MALLKALQVVQKLVVPSANGATDVCPVVGDYTIKTGDLAGDVIELCPLPGDYVVVDTLVDHDALAATSVGNIGIMSGNFNDNGNRTVGAQFNASSNFAVAGIKRMDVAGCSRILPTTNDRSVGIVLTSLTTPVIGAKIRMTLFVRPKSEGV